MDFAAIAERACMSAFRWPCRRLMATSGCDSQQWASCQLTWRGAPGQLAIVLYKAPERKTAVLSEVCVARYFCDYALRHLQHERRQISGLPTLTHSLRQNQLHATDLTTMLAIEFLLVSSLPMAAKILVCQVAISR